MRRGRCHPYLGSCKLISNHYADHGLVIVFDPGGVPAPQTPRDRWLIGLPGGAAAPPDPPKTDYGLGMTGGLRIILARVGIWKRPDYEACDWGVLAEDVDRWWALHPKEQFLTVTRITGWGLQGGCSHRPPSRPLRITRITN